MSNSDVTKSTVQSRNAHDTSTAETNINPNSNESH